MEIQTEMQQQGKPEIHPIDLITTLNIRENSWADQAFWNVQGLPKVMMHWIPK